jgi:Holin of 3TMs, for gene-transfer release
MNIWNLVAGPVLSIINKIIPDKAAAAAAQIQLQTMVTQGAMAEELKQLESITTAQSDINKVEAASPTVFVSGWRPAIGWVCALALAFQYLVRPIVGASFSIAGHTIPAIPGLDDNLWQLLFGMLGMGALRTVEKFKGVAAV